MSEENTTTPKTPEAVEASEPIANQDAQQAIQPPASNGRLIESNKVYAYPGSTVLGIVDILRKKIPTEFAGIVYAVEEALASGQELEVRPAPESAG